MPKTVQKTKNNFHFCPFLTQESDKIGNFYLWFTLEIGINYEKLDDIVTSANRNNNKNTYMEIHLLIFVLINIEIPLIRSQILNKKIIQKNQKRPNLEKHAYKYTSTQNIKKFK